MKRWMKFAGPLVVAGVFSVAYMHGPAAPSTALAQAVAPAAPEVTAAIAVVRPTTGNTAAGTVRFTATDGGIKVVADFTGLSPGKHGFHIHEWGDISDEAKAMATGGHYDPEHTMKHELVDSDHMDGEMHHAGDMGNLDAGADGAAHVELTLPGVTMMGKDPIVGRAVIVHAKADDGGQPTGNAGGRIAQGVIGIAKP